MEEKRIKNKIYLIIGLVLLIIGIILIINDLYNNKKIEIKEEKLLENYYKEEIIEDNIEIIEEQEEIIKVPTKQEQTKKKEKVNYIAVLKIPKIKLERGLVDPSSYLNNVKYNLEFLKGSSMPNQEYGNVMIAGHAGTSRISFFGKLNKLVVGDSVSIDYKGKEYNYKVVKIYDIDKTGTAKILKEENTTTLTLITCRSKTKKQIVIICEQI